MTETVVQFTIGAGQPPPDIVEKRRRRGRWLSVHEAIAAADPNVADGWTEVVGLNQRDAKSLRSAVGTYAKARGCVVEVRERAEHDGTTTIWARIKP